MGIKFDLQKAVHRINDEDAKLVLIQVPEGIKTKVLGFIEELKTCSKCKVEKSIQNFYLRKNNVRLDSEWAEAMFTWAAPLQDGIAELIRGYQILQHRAYANV